jgi:hypothetical protein
MAVRMRAVLLLSFLVAVTTCERKMYQDQVTRTLRNMLRNYDRRVQPAYPGVPVGKQAGTGMCVLQMAKLRWPSA